MKSNFFIGKNLKLKISKYLALLLRKFPGLKKTFSRYLISKDTIGCIYDNIFFPYDKNLMDEKRLIAIASGAMEREEILTSIKYFDQDDIIVEFGCGLGISSSLIQNKLKTKMFCFDANSKAVSYANKLFKINNLNLTALNIALGDGKKNVFFVNDDYLLSSFDKPNKKNFNVVNVNTNSLKQIIKKFKPTAILCDIEGAEKKYFDPTKLANVKKIVIELHPNVYGKKKLKEIISNFEENNFKLIFKIKQTYFFKK